MGSSYKGIHPVVKWNKKMFDLIWFDFMSFQVLKIRCFDAKKITLFLVLTKNPSYFKAHTDIRPPEYTPTKKDLSPDINLGLYSGFYIINYKLFVIT